MPLPPVAVVGLGQLGGSLAAALAAAGRPVSGWDVDPAARDAAEARGVRISRELAGVVVLAVPLPVMATALDGLSVDPDATVTDLGSVKAPVLASVGAAFGARFVGGHPMCGTERSVTPPSTRRCSPARGGRSAWSRTPTCAAGCGSPRSPSRSARRWCR